MSANRFADLYAHTQQAVTSTVPCRAPPCLRTHSHCSFVSLDVMAVLAVTLLLFFAFPLREDFGGLTCLTPQTTHAFNTIVCNTERRF